MVTTNGRAAAASAPIQIIVPEINIQHIEITLVGDSPLIVHKWSEKAKQMIADKQQKKAVKAREAKDPEEEFRASLHTTEDGKYAFPAVGFKAAMVSACRYADMRMTVARGAFHVEGEMVELISGEPTMRTDMVRIGMGVADIRYRGQFSPWAARLNIAYNASAVSPSQLVNLLNIAGFGVGVGEWRPERDGSYGRFHVQAGDESLPE